MAFNNQLIYMKQCIFFNTTSEPTDGTKQLLPFPFVTPAVISYLYYRITKEGAIVTTAVLNPKTTYSFTAYLSFQGIALNGDHINGRITTRVYVTVKG